MNPQESSNTEITPAMLRAGADEIREHLGYASMEWTVTREELARDIWIAMAAATNCCCGCSPRRQGPKPPRPKAAKPAKVGKTGNAPREPAAQKGNKKKDVG